MLDQNGLLLDGIHGMVPRGKMSPPAGKLRDFYALKPGSPIYQKDFGFYSLTRWIQEGHITANTDLSALFGYDPPATVYLGGLGWCEAAFIPAFEEKVIEDRGQYELVQDVAGRHVLCFKGRRSGFMPEYAAHPVKDRKTWEENCKWRLDPKTPARYQDLPDRLIAAREDVARGFIVSQNLIGGYMFLRSLIGPLDLLYMFHDAPDLIHDCMKTWLELADAVTAAYQQVLTLDELFIGEDICYNHGLLISPAMVEEFLLPYYQELITRIKARQIDRNRHLYFAVDTDGFCNPAIPVYRKVGLDYMNPFEVAAGCDVVAVGRQYPDLLMHGGFDKRILAQGSEMIDREVDRIMPVMFRRGGYIPTCDHGVPEEVSFEDYCHFRKRIREYSG